MEYTELQKVRFKELFARKQRRQLVVAFPVLAAFVAVILGLEDTRSWLGEEAHGLCHVGCVAKPPEDNHAPSPDKGNIAEPCRKTVTDHLSAQPAGAAGARVVKRRPEAVSPASGPQQS